MNTFFSLKTRNLIINWVSLSYKHTVAERVSSEKQDGLGHFSREQGKYQKIFNF